MLRSLIVVCLATLLLTTACGGDSDSSGLDRSLELGSLSSAEQQTLCEFVVDAAGGAGTEFTCGDDIVVTVQSVQDCLDGITATNTCTVAQAEDCATSDPCDFAPCLPLIDCQ